LATVGTNGVATRNDFQLPFNIPSMTNTLQPSGILSTDTNYVSGFFLNPNFFGARLAAEANLWTLWRPRWFKLIFQTYQPTSVAGILTLAFSRDPNAFIEVASSSTVPVQSYANLVENIPNCSGSLYRDLQFLLNDWDPNKVYPTSINTSLGSPGQNSGTFPWNWDRYCGRIAGLLQGNTSGAVVNYGSLYLVGSIDFFGSKATNAVISTTVTGTGFTQRALHHHGELKSYDEARSYLDVKQGFVEVDLGPIRSDLKSTPTPPLEAKKKIVPAVMAGVDLGLKVPSLVKRDLPKVSLQPHKELAPTSSWEDEGTP